MCYHVTWLNYKRTVNYNQQTHDKQNTGKRAEVTIISHGGGCDDVKEPAAKTN